MTARCTVYDVDASVTATRDDSMEYSVEQAQAQCEELIEKAAAGEEVLIVREDRPTVRLIAIDLSSEVRATAE
jgi:prevent-host-death family protein